jgi:hypothetical protein
MSYEGFWPRTTGAVNDGCGFRTLLPVQGRPGQFSNSVVVVAGGFKEAAAKRLEAISSPTVHGAILVVGKYDARLFNINEKPGYELKEITTTDQVA